MSWLCDSTELISGSWLTSAYAGHGILAEDIPATGEHGASVLYDQVTLPADNGKEIRAEILTTPTGLTTWLQDEDGTVDATAPDGVYTYPIQVYVDGVALGSTKTVTLTFGAAGASSSLAATGLPGTLSATSSVAGISSGLIAICPDGVLGASSSSAVLSALSATGLSGTLQASSRVGVSDAPGGKRLPRRLRDVSWPDVDDLMPDPEAAEADPVDAEELDCIVALVAIGVL